jgi:RimJ/RimL family protein N-acetyltransferase
MTKQQMQSDAPFDAPLDSPSYAPVDSGDAAAAGLAIKLVDSAALPAFFAYLNDHLSDNARDGAPYFQPMPRAQSRLPQEKAVVFKRGAQVRVGEPGWRRIWVAVSSSGQIAGHIDLRAHPERHTSHRCLLGMGVHRDYRNRGVGRGLLRHAERWARQEANLEWIDLQVLSVNHPAIALYVAAGFHQTGEIADMFRLDGVSLSYTGMAKKIAPPVGGIAHPSAAAGAQSVVIRTLQPGDAQALLEFELANREWFERHIDPRPPQFYSPQGVASHIADYLERHAAGNWHPCVVLDQQGRIAGRANLKDIDRGAGRAEIGYRIAQSAAGKGLATAALQHLVSLASTHWRLKEVFAEVTADNEASARVLEKCGFVRGELLPELAQVAGKWVDGHRFVLRLDKPAS